jgi:glucokinase
MNTMMSGDVKGAPPVLALDIGGTWTRAAAVSTAGRILSSARERTQSDGNSADFVGQCVRLLTAIREDGFAESAALGVSATGPLDAATGTLYHPPNTGAALADLPLAALLGSALGLPVVVDKDTNAAVIAEQRYGAARGAKDIVYLTVSTGVGASVMMNGLLMRGVDGTAGEFGHVVIEPGGPHCGCGRRGCLEAVASGQAIAAAGRRAAAHDPTSILACTARVQSPGLLEGAHVAAAAAAGDDAAASIMTRARDAVVSACVDLVNVFNPETLVLAGSVVRGNPQWVELASQTVKAEALSPANLRARIRPAELGDDGGLLGAALLVT